MPICSRTSASCAGVALAKHFPRGRRRSGTKGCYNVASVLRGLKTLDCQIPHSLADPMRASTCVLLALLLGACAALQPTEPSMSAEQARAVVQNPIRTDRDRQ